MTEPSSPRTASDNGVPALCLVAWAEEISKAVVKAADPGRWWDLWTALATGIEGAKDQARKGGQAYPWEDDEAVSHIGWPAFQGVLEDAIMTTLPANSDIPERMKLVRAAAAAYERVMARGVGSGKALRQTRFGIKVCALPRCGKRFAARSHRHTYCSTACRVAAYEARRRANGQAQKNVREAAV